MKTKYNKILIHAPGNIEDTILNIGAIKPNVLNFTKPILVDILVEDKESLLIAEQSQLFFKCYCSDNPEQFISENCLKYDGVHTILPSEEEGKTYGIEKSEKIKKELEKHTGDKAPDVPAYTYNYLMTAAKNLSLFYKDFDPHWDIEDKIDINEMLPYYRVTKKEIENINTLLRKSFKRLNGTNINTGIPYIILCKNKNTINNSIWEEVYNTINVSEVVFIDTEGNINNGEGKLNKIEQLALLEHPDCLGIVGSGFLCTAGVKHKDKFILDISEDKDMWKTVRNAKYRHWDPKLFPIEKLPEAVNEVCSILVN